MLIYRDDDISKYTDLTTLINVHGLFTHFNKLHTVTLIMDGLWKHRGLWHWLMTTPNLDIQLHGWKHWDYSTMEKDTIKAHLEMALEYYASNNDRYGYKYKPLSVFYPPWNKTSPALKEMCDAYALKLDANVNPREVFNFHWWEHVEGRDMDKLVKELSAVTVGINDTTDVV